MKIKHMEHTGVPKIRSDIRQWKHHHHHPPEAAAAQNALALLACSLTLPPPKIVCMFRMCIGHGKLRKRKPILNYVQFDESYL